jgi:hypothetical protein
MATEPRAWWRTELPFLVALLVALAVRIAVAYAFPPAFLMSDGPTYLVYADHLAPSPDRPVGYSFFLRGLSEVTRSLALVTSVQLVLGLLTAVLGYTLLRRRGVNPWVATLATLPVLFDAMQLLLEHSVLSDVLFGFLVVAAVAALAWWPVPRWWTTVVAGALLGLATLVRVVGEPMVVLAALFLLLVAMPWRERLVQVVLVIAAFAVPVAVYATWFHQESGDWALSQASGRALYMRTTTFVDCQTLDVPRYERVLCPTDPLGQRRDPTYYGWHSPETIPRLHPPAGVTDNEAMRDFALRAIEQQPGDYARTVWRDFRLAFTAGNRDDYYEMTTSLKWTFVTYVDYRPTAWTRPAFEAHGGRFPESRQPWADRLVAYQHHVYLRGPMALVLVVLAVVGAAVRRREQPSLRPLTLLLLALPLMLIAIPDLTAEFVWRYQLPLVWLLPLSSALGVTRIIAAWTDRRAAAATAGGEGEGDQPGTRATASTD